MSYRNVVLVIFLYLFANSPVRVQAQSEEKGAVEARVREFERAVEEFDFDKQISLMIPDGKWIEEDSYPVAADYVDDWWREAKKAKLRISNHPHDFELHVQGDVAWVIVFVDVTTIVDNEAARAFTARTHPNEQNLDGTFCRNRSLEQDVQWLEDSAGARLAFAGKQIAKKMGAIFGTGQRRSPRRSARIHAAPAISKVSEISLQFA